MPTFERIYIHGFDQSSGRAPSLRERANMRKTCGPYQWTPRDPLKSDGLGFYCTSRGLACGDGPVKLRLEWANDQEIGRQSDIRGYYTDSDGCGDTIKPIIARLAHGRGFLAGWTMGEGMCATIGTSIYDTPESAAMAAHSEAEYVAGEEVARDEERREQEMADELCEQED